MSTEIDLTKATRAPLRQSAGDRSFSEDKGTLRFYTIESISENRSYTPEKYLLCENATLSRTGTMLYKGDEVPVTPGADGLVTVVRFEEDVFKPESIASANGKSVCNNHPAEGQDITPLNWRALEVGVILHPRRGTGAKKDCLVADLLVKDEEAIKLIESGKVQLSCGYDADYEELKPGYAKQYNIIINHVAIVEHGRCGPRCAIMDEDTLRLNQVSPSGKAQGRKANMAKDLDTAIAELQAALKRRSTSDEETTVENSDILALALEGLNNRMADIERRLGTRDRRRRDDDDDTRDSRRHHNDRYSRDDDDDRRSRDRRDARRRRDDDDDMRDSRRRDDDDDMRDSRRRDDDDDDRRSRDRRDSRRRDDDDDKHRDARRRRDDDDDAHFTDRHELEQEAGEKNKDRARKAKDSAFLEDSWRETISLAECLLPGVQPPKFTRDARPLDTMNALCAFRKNVLSTKFTQPEGRQLILEMNRGEAPDFQGMSCAAARTLFRDCAIVAKRFNNSAVARDATSFGLVQINNPVIGNPAAYNEWNAKHWESHYSAGDTKKVN